MNFNLQCGHAMTVAVSSRPVTAETRARSRKIPFEICRGQSGTETDFCPRTGIPLPVSSHQCPRLTFMNELFFPEGQTGEAWEPSRRSALSEFGEHRIEQ